MSNERCEGFPWSRANITLCFHPQHVVQEQRYPKRQPSLLESGYPSQHPGQGQARPLSNKTQPNWSARNIDSMKCRSETTVELFSRSSQPLNRSHFQCLHGRCRGVGRRAMLEPNT